MSAALATVQQGASMEGLEAVLLQGDLKSLSSEQRITYYQKVCASVGLNALTQPFEFLNLQGKLILYARRACTDQLRHIHNVSIVITARERTDGIYIVTARATLPNGRTDESIGAVPIEGLKGEMLSNAMLKAETKSKRRVTLAICGLSFMDETEVESVQAVRAVEPPTREAVQQKVAVRNETRALAASDVQRIVSKHIEHLPEMQDVEALVEWAGWLKAQGFDRAAVKGAWSAFAERCAKVGLNPTDLQPAFMARAKTIAEEARS